MATAEQLNQAVALIQGNQHADAEALLTPLLNQSATDADVWQLIALARKGQLDLAGAEAAFKQSIDLHAAPPVVTNLGNLYRQMGREEDALACYNRALEAAPTHLPARVNKGRSLLALSRLEEAATLYTAILEELPEHINARIGLAQSLQSSGQTRAATVHFEKVLAHEPDNAAALKWAWRDSKGIWAPRRGQSHAETRSSLCALRTGSTNQSGQRPGVVRRGSRGHWRIP